MDITASEFIGNTAGVSDAIIVHNLVVLCYSSNASFRTISDTAACIASLLCVCQDGGAIANASGSINITGSKFVGNTGGVSELCA
jgi:hypothetical protein